MENLNQFSLPAILSNILPGFLANFIGFIIFYDLDPLFVKENSALSILLLLLSCILTGQIIDFGSHVWFSKWRKKKKHETYWQDNFENNILKNLIDKQFPQYQNKNEEEYTDFVEAYFTKNASEHILNRKTWEGSLHDLCRNTLIASLFFFMEFVIYFSSNNHFLFIIISSTAAIGILDYFFLWKYMIWSIHKYYEYNLQWFPVNY